MRSRLLLMLEESKETYFMQYESGLVAKPVFGVMCTWVHIHASIHTLAKGRRVKDNDVYKMYYRTTSRTLRPAMLQFQVEIRSFNFKEFRGFECTKGNFIPLFAHSHSFLFLFFSLSLSHFVPFSVFLLLIFFAAHTRKPSHILVYGWQTTWPLDKIIPCDFSAGWLEMQYTSGIY